jgi:manganese/zinc/iron transport system permease protein
VVGAGLVVALLLAPAAAARQFGGSVTRVATTSAALGAASAVGGVALSLSSARIPTGSAIALVASGVFLASVLLRGRRAQRGPSAATRREAAA